MPMGDGQKSKSQEDSVNVERNFAEAVRATEKKEQQHAVCGSYGKGKKEPNREK